MRDASEMARMFAALDALPVPLIGRVQGAALGGGAGLAAVCDIVVAEERPSLASPRSSWAFCLPSSRRYVLAKIGAVGGAGAVSDRRAFSAMRAREIGLVHAVVPAGGAGRAVDSIRARSSLARGPEAIAAAKALIRRSSGRSLADARR